MIGNQSIVINQENFPFIIIFFYNWISLNSAEHLIIKVSLYFYNTLINDSERWLMPRYQGIWSYFPVQRIAFEWKSMFLVYGRAISFN